MHATSPGLHNTVYIWSVHVVHAEQCPSVAVVHQLMSNQSLNQILIIISGLYMHSVICHTTQKI